MPFDSLKFRYNWRPYQQRVLDAIDVHLGDQKLHVVVAPGAGKTTLGIEIFRRLQKRALILSPTRVIRDQWVSRLNDFCEEGNQSNLQWTSKHFDKISVFTSITYQALHAKAEKNNELEEDLNDDEKGLNKNEIADFIKKIRDNKIEVIIMDEAHHLRSEWWKAITKVCDALPDLILVSLTATPPYDTPGHELSKYEQLCGPIDEQISVPELVKAGTLCPHQDYIWATNLNISERKK